MLERTVRRIGLLGASAALFAACAGGGAATTAPTTNPATAAPTTAATSAPTQASAGLTLGTGTAAALGTYITGADGKSLYVFEKDTGTTSACTGGCADNWPPLTVSMLDDVTAGAGVTGPLGTITRDDGTLQVTIAGHPLYYFKGDAAAGDVNGQGINDVWYLAGVDGSALGESGSAATTAPGDSKCSGPTCY